MIRPVALLAILLAPFAFALEEVPVAPVTFGDAAIAAPTLPVMASDGESYFVVWSDDREGVPAVYGARLTADREVLDPVGVRPARRACGALGRSRHRSRDRLVRRR